MINFSCSFVLAFQLQYFIISLVFIFSVFLVIHIILNETLWIIHEILWIMNKYKGYNQEMKGLGRRGYFYVLFVCLFGASLFPTCHFIPSFSELLSMAMVGSYHRSLFCASTCCRTEGIVIIQQNSKWEKNTGYVIRLTHIPFLTTW